MQALSKQLLALLLTATMAFVQTAMPCLHSGCSHDHSSAASAGQATKAHRCQGHHHAAASIEVAPSGLAIEHGHHQAVAGDCAACRFLLLSLVVVETASVALIEDVSLLHSPPPVAPLTIELAGPYRSRAPPALA